MPDRKNVPKYFGIPFIGLVRAGFPSPAEEELSDTLTMDEYLIENKEATFLMRVKGDAMIGAGIIEGDMLIVERRNEAKPGEIVIAVTDGNRVIRYLRKRTNKYYLESANDDFKPIVPENSLKIEAVVKAVVRKY